ncbi:MAG: RDD family protein [Dehalococcoidia bacterium]
MEAATAPRIAGFWPRVAASLIDGFVLMPLTTPTAFIIGYGPAWVAIAWLVLTTPTAWLYTIICHGRWGKTLGKHILEMRLARADDGGRIGYSHAVRRDIPILAFGIVSTVLLVRIVATGATEPFRYHLPEQRYDENPTLEEVYGDFFEDLYPYPVELLAVSVLQIAWFWAEVTTMLTNRRRRALHDYLGGTIVVRTNTERPRPGTLPGALPPPVQRESLQGPPGRGF